MADDGDAGSEAAELEAELRDLRREFEAFEDRVEERTVHRSSVETELRRYVRRELARGHARDWGPYLVLLYGTAMTVGAFYFLRGGWAILAMIVIWLSTLGLYVLMLLVGVMINLVSGPRRLVDAVRDRRS